MSTCDLSHVSTESSDAAYYCFDRPLSVFSDVSGAIVTGDGGTYFVSDNVDGGREIIRRELSASKIYRYSVPESSVEFLIALRDGKLYSYPSGGDGTEFTPDGIKGLISDFAVDDGVLYAVTESQLIVADIGDTEIAADGARVYALSSDRHSFVVAERISALDGRLYFTLDAVFGNKQDICCVAIADIGDTEDAVALSTVLRQSDNIISLTSSADGKLYTLTRSELTCYSLSVGRGLYEVCTTDGSEYTDIYADRDKLFALDSLNALHELSADLKDKRTLAASASYADGFFNIPSGVAAKSSTLYVADTMNGRIAAYNNGGIRYIDRRFDEPVSVALDNTGAMYVAYDNNKIGIFRSAAYTPDDEITVTDTALGKIKQILVDNERTLFVLAESGLWKSSGGGALLRINETRFKAINLSIGKNKLFALTDEHVVCLNKDGKATEQTYSVGADAISVAVDLNETAFVLYRDKITSITAIGASKDFALTLNGEPFTVSDKTGQIMLCFIEDSLTDKNGDAEISDMDYIIVLDPYRHRVFKAKGEPLGARYVDFSYKAPDIVNGTDATAKQSGIIRTVKTDVPLFAYPIETKSEYTVVAGRNVIVPDYKVVAPDYDPDETPEFALILVDDTVNNRLIQGFIYKDALSEPLEYAAPPSDICTVFAALGTPIYKWPSRNANAIDGYSDVPKNTKFTMLDFVGSFRDDYGFYWYRIALPEGNAEGYITAVNVSTIDYQQTNILPEYNAEIISYKNSKFAQAYTTDKDGKYIAIPEITLKTGTKVEVVGSFDTSVRYTKIKFLDEKTHKTVTCYVETAYLQYTGVNIVLIAAIIVIAITAILATIIIARTVRAKKKRAAPAEEPKDEESAE